jgi:hypothetical protein
MRRRRLLGATTGIVLSLAVAGTAFADSCANISASAAAPACHPTCATPVIRGNWVWLPSIGVPFEAWGFAAPGGTESVNNDLPGANGNFSNGVGDSLLVNAAYCTKGVNTDRSHGIVSGCH